MNWQQQRNTHIQHQLTPLSKLRIVFGVENVKKKSEEAALYFLIGQTLLWLEWFGR